MTAAGEPASSSSSPVRPLLSVSMPSACLSVPCRYSPLLPKLIFLDLHMPVLDGFQTALAVRRMGFDCPIVALTASVGSADQQTAERLGFLRYLTKPISRPQLREATQIAVDHGNVAAGEMEQRTATADRLRASPRWRPDATRSWTEQEYNHRDSLVRANERTK